MCIHPSRGLFSYCPYMLFPCLSGKYLSFDLIFFMDYISRTCIGFLIFIDVITVLKHLTFNYYVYLMRMTLYMAAKEIMSCVVVIGILITAFASYSYLTVGVYLYAFRDMLGAVMTKLRTAIAIVKMNIYFQSTIETSVLDKIMFISFFFILTLVMMNTFISVINNAMEAVKGNKVSKARKRLLFDEELNKFFWRRITRILNFGKRDTYPQASRQLSEFRGGYYKVYTCSVSKHTYITCLEKNCFAFLL